MLSRGSTTKIVRILSHKLAERHQIDLKFFDGQVLVQVCFGLHDPSNKFIDRNKKSRPYSAKQGPLGNIKGK